MFDHPGWPVGPIVQDTFTAGSLSSDGRWWMRLLPLESGDWVLGRNASLTNGAETTIPDLARTKVPYDYSTVGYEPDGAARSLSP